MIEKIGRKGCLVEIIDRQHFLAEKVLIEKVLVENILAEKMWSKTFGRNIWGENILVENRLFEKVWSKQVWSKKIWSKSFGRKCWGVWFWSKHCHWSELFHCQNANQFPSESATTGMKTSDFFDENAVLVRTQRFSS